MITVVEGTYNISFIHWRQVTLTKQKRSGLAVEPNPESNRDAIFGLAQQAGDQDDDDDNDDDEEEEQKRRTITMVRFVVLAKRA